MPRTGPGRPRTTCRLRLLSSSAGLLRTLCRESAADVLTEYFERIGGRPEPKGQKRKGRPSNAGLKPESATPASSVKRVKAEKEWSPPPGSWEHDVDYVDNVEETADPRTGEHGRFAYLIWKNHNKTQHPLKHVYQKCPQKVRYTLVWRDSLKHALEAHVCTIAKIFREADYSGRKPVTNSSQMLTYYESHLVFTTQGAADEPLNGDDGTDVVMKSY
jgi:hypothetical protein